tara:strand:+ start:938 stop:1351 length:414 start_codon:yes stop_codon:yes gene_type:complete
MIEIRFATSQDYDYLVHNDRQIKPEVVKKKIEDAEIIVVLDDEQNIGWLRFNYFWDEIPFMNMLWIEEDYRRKGIGTRLVNFWETEISQRDKNQVMTSTLSDETAQHFYRKLEYQDCGSLLLPDEALEIFFLKSLNT